MSEFTFDHVGLRAGASRRELDILLDVFGLHHERTVKLPQLTAIQLRSTLAGVELLLEEGDRARSAQPELDHLAFSTADFDGAVARLRERGFVTRRPEPSTAAGYRSHFFRQAGDPAALLYQVIERET